MDNKNTKELNNIVKSIREWMKKYNGGISFVGSFVAFDKDGEFVDDTIMGYGEKEAILLMLRDMGKMARDEKSKFINW